MNFSFLAVGSLAGALALTLASSAHAQANGPCGNFDFSGGIDCAIQVEASCSANCTALKFEVGCTGVCTEVAAPPCVDSCGTACLAECDPALLDCFVGCHDECDQPTIDICTQQNPNDDCVEIAEASCDIHCKDSCAVPPSDCLDHCETCCTGGCATQANYDCNYDCFAELSGSCEAHCDTPEGSIFCNGQYVNASDIEACIAYLLEQGIEVDVSAQGTVSCGPDGCDAESALSGCSASPGPSPATGAGWGVLGLCAMGLVIGVANERRRRRR